MFRYRQVSCSLFPEVRVRLIDSPTVFNEFGSRRASAQPGETSAEVTVKEGALPWGELARMLQAGELMPSDLVFSRGAWTTFYEAAEFLDVTENLPDRRVRIQKLTSALVFLGILAFAALWVSFRRQCSW
jgi:hypothetical protein